MIRRRSNQQSKDYRSKALKFEHSWQEDYDRLYEDEYKEEGDEDEYKRYEDDDPEELFF